MPTFDFEEKYEGPVAGIDEVGVGCWAGPVMACAAILPKDLPLSLLTLIDDSKKLTRKKRDDLIPALKNAGIVFHVASASVEEIDQINIREAALLAMKRAVEGLDIKPSYCLIDGIAKPTLSLPFEMIKGGDAKSYSIAAASIIAKVTRDTLMEKLAKEHPYYAWEKNAGYGTKSHQDGLQQYGVTCHHRRSYAPIQRILEKMIAS